MKYKNITKSTLRFRAFNKDMEKVVFEVKPDCEITVGKEMKFGGMMIIEQEKKEKSGGKE